MITESIAYQSIVAVDLFNINKVGLIRKKQQEFSPDFLIQFVEALEKLELRLPIIYLGDSHLPWILKQFREAGKKQEDWFEDRISLPNNDPKKFWFVSKKKVKADYLLLALHNQFRALVISRDMFRDEIAAGVVNRPNELLRFECVTNDLDNSIAFTGRSYGCLNMSISSYDKPELNDSNISQIREIAINSLKEQLQDVKKKYTSQKSKSRIAKHNKELTSAPTGGNLKEKTNIVEKPPTGTDPATKIKPPVPPIEYLSVSLYNSRAMKEARDKDVLLSGTPVFNHKTSLWVLKWPMQSIVVDLPQEASKEIDSLMKPPSLVGVKGRLTHVNGDIYELTEFAGLVHGLHPELFPKASETPLDFAKWGSSLSSQLHQWRVKRTAVNKGTITTTEPSDPYRLSHEEKKSQRVSQPEAITDENLPENTDSKIAEKPGQQYPTAGPTKTPPTNPQPPGHKPPNPVGGTQQKESPSTPKSTPPTVPIREPEEPHADSEKNSKWTIVWIVAAMASILAVISQIL